MPRKQNKQKTISAGTHNKNKKNKKKDKKTKKQ